MLEIGNVTISLEQFVGLVSIALVGFLGSLLIHKVDKMTEPKFG